MYAFNRDPDHPVCVFDKDGNFLWSWGQGLIAFAHAIIIDKDENVWLVDRNTHEVHKYTKEGAHLMTIGRKGERSDTGADSEDYSSTAFQTVTHGGPPFNMPAGIAFNDEGQIFIADGYANARVHKFTPQGDLIKSWGGPGAGAGEFRLPHGIWIDRHERVLVADRGKRPGPSVHPGRGVHLDLAHKAHRPGPVLRRLRRHRLRSGAQRRAIQRTES